MKRVGADGHSRASEARVLKLNEGGKRSVVDNLVAELLIASDEHPDERRHDSALAVVLGETEHANDKAGEEVALHVGVVLLDPLAHEGVKATAAHIRRIRNGAGKTTGQLLADGGSAFELSFGRSGKKVIGTYYQPSRNLNRLSISFVLM